MPSTYIFKGVLECSTWVLNFIYSEKSILKVRIHISFDVTKYLMSKLIERLLQIFVAFSENLNFRINIIVLIEHWLDQAPCWQSLPYNIWNSCVLFLYVHNMWHVRNLLMKTHSRGLNKRVLNSFLMVWKKKIGLEWKTWPRVIHAVNWFFPQIDLFL